MKATLYRIKTSAPGCLAIVARPRGGDWLCDEVKALSREGVDVLVSMLTEEESRELGLEGESVNCKTGGIMFINIPVSDRSVPTNREKFLQAVDVLTQFVREGKFVAVHCRASIGRSSILAVALLT